MHRPLRLLAAIAVLTCLAVPAAAERLGLVIGINQYHALAPLKNAVADAEAIAATLRATGFTVPDEWLLKNPGKREMDDAINALAAATKPGDEVFLYFSGHGVQIGAEPLMMPADVRDPVHRANGQLRSHENPRDIYEATAQVKRDGVSLQAVANTLAERAPRLSLVVVDACRDNPVIELLREAQRYAGKSMGGGTATTGFDAIEKGENQVVIFAAGKGERALDRLGPEDGDKNSVFARVLLKKMSTPGLPLSKLYKEVKDEVPRLASQYVDPVTREPHRQKPVALASYGMEEFYFVPAASAAAPAPVPPPRVQVAQTPSGGGLDLEDLKKQEAVRQQWEKWQAGMKAAFAEVEGLSGTAEAKVLAWDRYLSAYAQDNPFSAEDETLRAQAQAKRAEAQRAAEQQKDEAGRQQQLVQQAAEEAARRQRDAKRYLSRQEAKKMFSGMSNDAETAAKTLGISLNNSLLKYKEVLLIEALDRATDVNSYHDDLDQLEGKYIDFVRFTIPIEDRYVLKSKGDAKKFRATDQTRLKASFEQAAKIIDALLARIALSGAAISINEPGRP